ncbi:conserved hypothetical protein [Vibrio nigripulchritudo SO65]|uniref:NlpC/P60 family protein n=1 Tax=Vibrio nigripulchritudo TaxID=28173 RepID=UPI0003B1E15E|nr:TIGR02594 family protein [Vibrio nigripulchritudo]CCN35597.1 conserved hypothetical protein [Vibrio nigripulchritudo AM115]CCN40818.1 conserved hypothetical protein [Vibrio nigripulchritudo FTn2]CCN67330.1 conserved hypothetical protein [Vibrio nigripulchritudo POn4]CCN74263.1 conserved hypothetical protein [Vibrio nigripulchritudo SO65]
MYNKLLKKGVDGREVVALQFYLNKLLMPSKPTLLDGKFGSGTEKLVKKFQEKFELTSDGEVGKNTWNVLLQQNSKKSYRKPLKYSNKCTDIAHLQNALNKLLNLSPKMSTDGQFGKNTDRYVREFQAKLSLGVDGIVGKDTWITIEQLLTNKTAIITLNFIQKSAYNLRNLLTRRGENSWVKIAEKEVDPKISKEIKGPKHNPRIIEYHSTTTLKAQSDETPWCSSFVNWVMIKSGYKGTNSAAAISWMKWGQKVASTPGAIVVIYNASAANSNLTRSGNHVGFLISENDQYFEILGGNQRDQVKVSFYPKRKWKALGYRLPN